MNPISMALSARGVMASRGLPIWVLLLFLDEEGTPRASMLAGVTVAGVTQRK